MKCIIVSVLISTVISTCISKIMAEHYLDLMLGLVEKMYKDIGDSTRESIRNLVDLLSRR